MHIEARVWCQHCAALIVTDTIYVPDADPPSDESVTTYGCYLIFSKPPPPCMQVTYLAPGAGLFSDEISYASTIPSLS